jgi:hypothetical protein
VGGQAEKFPQRLRRQVKEMRQRRDGSQGAASAVRVIDPANYQPPPLIAGTKRPPTKQFTDTSRMWTLERNADRLLQRTGATAKIMNMHHPLKRHATSRRRPRNVRFSTISDMFDASQ